MVYLTHLWNCHCFLPIRVLSDPLQRVGLVVQGELAVHREGVVVGLVRHRAPLAEELGLPLVKAGLLGRRRVERRLPRDARVDHQRAGAARR